MQTRLGSFVEAWTSVVIGMAVSLVLQLIYFPLEGIEITLLANLRVLAVFTAVSFARSYLVRRFFNWLHARKQLQV